MAKPNDETRERIGNLLEAELARVKTPEAADAVIEQAERLAQDRTEGQEADAAAGDLEPAVPGVEQAVAIAAGRQETEEEEAAAVLTAAAREAVGTTPEAGAVVDGAQRAMAVDGEGLSPEARQGSALLKDAVLRHMDPLHRLDAQIYLALNGIPHPPWSDRLAGWVTVWSTGGWIWAGAVWIAYVAGVPRSRRALTVLLPSMIGATWLVEFQIKRFFKRRRPFIDNVRALVVGKRPGSWSFPSGHTASSFACAWVLSTVWPRRAPLFMLLASSVGFSRIYVGAHYPGDVTSGAFCGMALAEVIRRLTRLVLRRAGARWIEAR